MSQQIWFKKDLTLDQINQYSKKTMHDFLGIQITELGNNSLKGTMPINEKTIQPQGRLHGGASLAFAETLGSIAANLCLNQEEKLAFGQSINANHLRPGLKGPATGLASPIHLGNSSHVWEIKIFDQNQKLLCISRLTMAVVSLSKHLI